MKISELERKLKEWREANGDLDVMITTGSTSSGGTWGVDAADCHTAEEGEYPKDWEMPEGYKFVQLSIFT